MLYYNKLFILSIVPETWVQSQVTSYQRLKKWYLMPPCLTLSMIRYGSRVKWSSPGKGVAPSPTPCWSSYRKGNPRVTLDYGHQLTFTWSHDCLLRIIVRTRQLRHCRKNKDELISDILLWTLTRRCSSVNWPVRIYLHQLCVDTGCSLEDLMGAMDDRDRCKERAREIHVVINPLSTLTQVESFRVQSVGQIKILNHLL